MEGVALRYWSNYHKAMVVRVVDVKSAEDKSAKGLMEIAKTTLANEHNICMEDGLLSSTFDGANVMSGEKG